MYTYVHTYIHISEYIWESVFIICWKCALISLKIPFVSWAHYLRMYVHMYILTNMLLHAIIVWIQLWAQQQNNNTCSIISLNENKQNYFIPFHFVLFTAKCVRRSSSVQCPILLYGGTCGHMWTDGRTFYFSLCVVCPPPEGVVWSDDLQIGTQSTGWGSGSVGLGDSSKYSNQFIGLFLNDYSYSMVHTRIVTNGYAEIFDGTAFVVVDTSVEQKKRNK